MLISANRRPRLMEVALVLVLAAGAFAAGVAFAAQPHMQAALSALQTAQSELNQAEHDKGGHRVKALNLVGQAIQQVQLGIAAGS